LALAAVLLSAGCMDSAEGKKFGRKKWGRSAGGVKKKGSKPAAKPFSMPQKAPPQLPKMPKIQDVQQKFESITNQKTEDAAADKSAQEQRPGAGSSRRRTRSRSREKHFPLRAAMTVLADLVGLVCAGCLWCLYLESNPTPGRIRSWGYLAVAAVSVTDFTLWYYEVAWSWLVLAALPVNVWGMLDAVMRFPAPHDVESLFTLKQFALLAAKVAMYTYGFVDFYASGLIYVTLFAVNVIGLPLFYFVALPMDGSRSKAATVDVGDVDVAVRLLRIITNTEERRHLWLGCARQLHNMLQGTVQQLPGTLQESVANVSPWCRHALKEGKGRRV
jgi:hypothetical protein